jgi:CRP-like cAMP-binding protein
MARVTSRDLAANLPVALRPIGHSLACPKDGWVFRKGDPVRAVFLVLAEFTRQWVALLARQLHASRARSERLALKSAAERVLHCLHTEGKGPRCEIMRAGSVKDFARELGLTHESLYRTLARLEQDGVIARKDQRLFIV